MKKTSFLLFLLAATLSLATVQAQETGYTNLARFTAVTSSGSENYINTPHLATDGCINTFWLSQNHQWKGWGIPEWICVDLGQVREIDKIVVKWDSPFAKHYRLEVSDEDTNQPSTWVSVAETIEGKGGTEVWTFAKHRARHVRLWLSLRYTVWPFAISEIEVYGQGELPLPKSKALPLALRSNQGWNLPQNWRLKPGFGHLPEGATVSQAEFDDAAWLAATVPGTVLQTYIDNKAVPDPMFGNNMLEISELFSTTAFMYRNLFFLPPDLKGKKIWLNFNGIFYAADLFVNGRFVSSLKRCFLRQQVDVTDFVTPGAANCVAVKIHPPANPGTVIPKFYQFSGIYGGRIARDMPAFIITGGWDGNPTVPGRNAGMWDEVYLSATAQVLVKDPLIEADLPLPDTTKASLSIRTWLHNTADVPQKGILRIAFDRIIIEKPVEIPANQEIECKILPSEYPQLNIENPKLWWPNGLGEQNLYHAVFEFITSEKQVSDRIEINFGIRELAFEYHDGKKLQIKANGCPVMCRGGNWESNALHVPADSQRYNCQLLFHKQMNFTMLRNWVGQTGHEYLYDYADKYGILIWDDFWLANTNNGPEPKDTELFMANVADKIKKIRHHPSVAIYCARNESHPFPPFDQAIEHYVDSLDNSRFFIQSTHEYPVNSNSGPWHLPDNTTQLFREAGGFQTERGLPSVPTLESMKAMIPAKHLWPINDMWGFHDYSVGACDVRTYEAKMRSAYGWPENIEEFCRKAQLINYDYHRALFEAWGSKAGTDNSGGVLLWMSNSVWPSTVWQTYDYFLEAGGSYFGSKKGCEPIHIQWDMAKDKTFVVNVTNKHFTDLMAETWIYSMQGKQLAYYSRQTEAKPFSSNFVHFISFDQPAISPVHFVKMRLSKDGKTLSDNFYWRGTQNENFSDLISMPLTSVICKAQIKTSGSKTVISLDIQNPGDKIAFFIRLKPVKAHSGERILPVVINENYFSLVPGENRKTDIQFDTKLLTGEKPAIVIEGWNLKPQTLSF